MHIKHFSISALRFCRNFHLVYLFDSFLEVVFCLTANFPVTSGIDELEATISLSIKYFLCCTLCTLLILLSAFVKQVFFIYRPEVFGYALLWRDLFLAEASFTAAIGFPEAVAFAAADALADIGNGYT